MTAVETGLMIAWWVIGVAFAASALFALWRMVKGPTIIDRMVASDTILTIAICVLGADMVANEHTATLPLMLVLAMTAFIASVAVARYVSRQDRKAKAEAGGSAPNGLADAEVGAQAAAGVPVDRTPAPDAAQLARERAPREAERRERDALEAEVHAAEEGRGGTGGASADADPDKSPDEGRGTP